MLHNTGILTITVLFQIYLMQDKIIRAFIISVNKKNMITAYTWVNNHIKSVVCFHLLLLFYFTFQSK